MTTPQIGRCIGTHAGLNRGVFVRCANCANRLRPGHADIQPALYIDGAGNTQCANWLALTPESPTPRAIAGLSPDLLDGSGGFSEKVKERMLLNDQGACRHVWSPEVLAIATTLADGCSTCARRQYEGDSIVPAALKMGGYWGCADRRAIAPVSEVSE